MTFQPLSDRLGNWPWCNPEEGGKGDKRHRFSLTVLPGGRCIGFARRRVGRGGRYGYKRSPLAQTFVLIDWGLIADVGSWLVCDSALACYKATFPSAQSELQEHG